MIHDFGGESKGEPEWDKLSFGCRRQKKPLSANLAGRGFVDVIKSGLRVEVQVIVNHGQLGTGNKDFCTLQITLAQIRLFLGKRMLRNGQKFGEMGFDDGVA